MDNRQQQIKEIFEAVSHLSPEERTKFLNENCQDEEMRRNVESLLANFSQMTNTGEIDNLRLREKKEQEHHQSFGHYKLDKNIGTGGMGKVYLAEDLKLERKVAIKFLNNEFSYDSHALRRFVQEAKSASSLNHPNILVIYEIGEIDSVHYIASEYIEGKTLRENLKESPMDLSFVLDISIQLTGAFSAAHAAHIIHRDIKPENIIVRSDGYVKILDFGLAKLIEKKNKSLLNLEDKTAKQTGTAQGTILGTVNYMSPEQSKGQPVDELTDIFSFGVILYEMITGRTPFAANSVSEVFANLINQEPLPLSRFSTNVPNEVQRIVSKTLRKNKADRYQTMKDLLADLKELKENLAFDKKLERVGSPNDKTLQLLQTDTKDLQKQTIKIQRSFWQKIKNHHRLSLVALLILLISSTALYYFTRDGLSNKQGNNLPIDSIAVLPFENAAQDPNAEYLSDGITESLINRLSQLSGLKVMSSSAVFRYKGREKETQRVGKELNVRAVLTGDVKQIGDQLIVIVRLDDAQDNHRIWGEQYVRKFSDVLAVQSEIVQEVSTNLRVKLSGADERKLTKNYTENTEAYQLYLKGMYEWRKHTQEDLQKSIEYFNLALEKDPDYARAYQGLCSSYGVLGNNYLPPREAYPKAKVYAAKALMLDDALAESHVAAGANNLYYDWNWAEAQREFKYAQALDSNYSDAHSLYGDSLEIMARFDEARAERRRTLDLDPLSPQFNMAYGATLYFARQNDEAIEQLGKTINLEPRFVDTYFYLGQAYEQKKMYEQAIKTYQQGLTQSERNPFLIAALGHAYGLSGKRDKAHEALSELQEMSQHQYISPYLVSLVYIGLNDKEQAITWLNKAYQDRSFFLIWLKVEPLFDSLRDEARFQDLLRRMNLTQ